MPREVIPRFGNAMISNVSGASTLWNPLYWSVKSATPSKKRRRPEKVRDYRWFAAPTIAMAEYGRFWKDVAPKLHAKLTRELAIVPDDEYADTAIVHLRCSDVPFINHNEYPLLPQKYYEFAAREVLRRGIRRVVLTNCYTHGQHPRAERECPIIADGIATWMRRVLGDRAWVDSQPHCWDQRTTLCRMLGCGVLISTGGSFSFPVGVCKGDAFVTPVLAGARARAEHRRLHDLVHWRMWDSIDYCEYPPPARWGWNISDTRTIPEGSARLIGLSGQLDSPGLASLAALAALVSLGFWLRRRPRGAGSPVVQISS